MADLIRDAKDFIAKAETLTEAFQHGSKLLPILRAFVEMAEKLQEHADLVREADGIIGDAYYSHYDARLSAADRCAWCKRAEAWRKKVQQ